MQHIILLLYVQSVLFVLLGAPVVSNIVGNLFYLGFKIELKLVKSKINSTQVNDIYILHL